MAQERVILVKESRRPVFTSDGVTPPHGFHELASHHLKQGSWREAATRLREASHGEQRALETSPVTERIDERSDTQFAQLRRILSTMTNVSKGGLNEECPSHGVKSIRGGRAEMEDAVAVIPSFALVPCSISGCNCRENYDGHRLHFFGVYDGHGGPQASLFCANNLHHALAEEMKPLLFDLVSSRGSSPDQLWQKVFSACFTGIERGVCWKTDNNPKNSNLHLVPDYVGSTAVVALVGPCQIVVANCGDSRAVLSRGGKAIPLSVDHKPDREDEMARIEAAGGWVIRWEGYRVMGLLATSRSIGDNYLKQYVISKPELTITERSEQDECLVLASDGLWDVMTSDQVCRIARKCLRGRLQMRAGWLAEFEVESKESPAALAAAVLTKLALSRGSTDNITVVVVDLMHQHEFSTPP